MYTDLLYTPDQDKYKASQFSSRKDRSTTFSQLNKSYTAHKSTEVGSASPYRSGAVSRLEDAKRTIDTVIGDLEEQRDMNHSAFREIKSVNSDVLEDLRRSLYGSKENASTYCPDYKSQASHYNLHSPATREDSASLRSLLNEEMRKNSSLMLRMSQMEEENNALRSGGGHYEVRELQSENERLRKTLSQVSMLPQAIFA
jgi:hypothetical protein